MTKESNAIGRLLRFLYLPQSAPILTSTSAVWSVATAMANPYQSVYFASLGASPFTIGLLVAHGTGVTAFALLVGGYIAATWGRRRVVIMFSWVSVIAAFIYSLIGSQIFILVPESSFRRKCLHPRLQFNHDGLDQTGRQDQGLCSVQRNKHDSICLRADSRWFLNQPIWGKAWSGGLLLRCWHLWDNRSFDKDMEAKGNLCGGTCERKVCVIIS